MDLHTLLLDWWSLSMLDRLTDGSASLLKNLALVNICMVLVMGKPDLNIEQERKDELYDIIYELGMHFITWFI